jgi:plastocyanin/methionine-rich copper-binding protein CopC
MNKKITFAVLMVIVIGVIVALTSANRSSEPEAAQENEVNESTNQGSSNDFTFSNPKKSAHYETNTPNHGSILAAPPINIVLDFNFDLAAPSEISIMKDGKEYGQGNTTIDSNKLTMRRNFASDAPDGLYKVIYNACWPDRTCHDGHFEFAIDRSLSSSYENLKNKPEVTIRLSEIMFSPKNIIISPGTKVTWINDEDVEHYINTDSHPAHTYFLSQNSRSLAKGASYSVTFEKPGTYPYHCSAHAATMVGNILVS